MCGFQAPYFCQSSYIISLGGPTFFFYVQKEKLDLQKRKLYISTEMLNYKCHRGWGFNLVSHRSDIFTGAFLWEGRKPSMAENPPISLSPTAVPSRLVALPGRGWNNAALVTRPSHMVGRLTVLPKWPPSLSSLFRNVSNPICHVPSSVYNLKK